MLMSWTVKSDYAFKVKLEPLRGFMLIMRLDWRLVATQLAETADCDHLWRIWAKQVNQPQLFSTTANIDWWIKKICYQDSFKKMREKIFFSQFSGVYPTQDLLNPDLFVFRMLDWWFRRMSLRSNYENNPPNLARPVEDVWLSWFTLLSESFRFL